MFFLVIKMSKRRNKSITNKSTKRIAISNDNTIDNDIDIDSEDDTKSNDNEVRNNNKEMSQRSTESVEYERMRLNKKMVELKLRGIDESNSEGDDKILSYFQMRQYLRVLRRFKGFVYFYDGSDEEHTIYNETEKKIKHLYYEPHIPNDIAKRLFDYMYLDRLIKNPDPRQSFYSQLKEKPQVELVEEIMEVSSTS